MRPFQTLFYYSPIVVKNFLAKAVVIYFFRITQSHIQPELIETIHITTYGKADHKPFSATLNFNTSFMYLGRSVTMVKKPQSWPICAATKAHTGADVSMCLHGMSLFTWHTLARKEIMLWLNQETNLQLIPAI